MRKMGYQPDPQQAPPPQQGPPPSRFVPPGPSAVVDPRHFYDQVSGALHDSWCMYAAAALTGVLNIHTQLEKRELIKEQAALAARIVDAMLEEQFRRLPAWRKRARDLASQTEGTGT